jgi:hypothetical protein
MVCHTSGRCSSVFFGTVVVALPADHMVKTVGGQARSCVSQLSVRFHSISIDHGFSGIELPPYILLLFPPIIQQCLKASVDGSSRLFLSSSTRKGSLAMVYASRDIVNLDRQGALLRYVALIFSSVMRPFTVK